jgi:conjugative relaxase-like TrwC/TraI family protein
MLRPKIQFNLANAKQYFREHLRAGDYYSENARVAGEWLGEGAKKLGLTGAVDEHAFLNLCEGQHPQTGKKLGQRKKTVRQEADGKVVANRRIFYDFAIAPPKSVSLVGLYQDDRILKKHDEAVRETMWELEKLAQTRVRKSGADDSRETGNLVVACFRHDTSRELDPQLHTHCVVFNATFDPAENRWKALQVEAIYRAQKFATNLYRHELCRGLRQLGYEIENDAHGFEIKGVPKTVITRFSKRHQQIDAEAERMLKMGSPVENLPQLRNRIAQDRRARKMKEATAERLRPAWTNQLTKEEALALGKLRAVQPPPSVAADMVSIVAWAEAHLFERRSVVTETELLSAALARGRGENFDMAALRAEVVRRDYLRQDGTGKLTTREVLGHELAVVVAAHDGRCRHAPLAPDFCANTALSNEQRRATERILGSRDFIVLFRGGAGTGKSFTLKEVQRGLVEAGHPVVVLAPQRQQVAALQSDSLPAQTLAQLLTTKTLPEGSVILLDEAGQVGGRDLHALVALVQARRGRLILSGDTRQHGAVAASDALLAIEKHSGLKPAVLKTIRRQDPTLARREAEKRFIGDYRTAVKAAAAGRPEEAFDRLDRLGCVREYALDQRYLTLAAEYSAAEQRGERALVIAQTWDEVHRANASIRTRLKQDGQLAGGIEISTFQPLNWTNAQKSDARFYEPGHHAVFLHRYGRFRPGDVCEIVRSTEKGLVLRKEGRESAISYRYASKLTVAAAAPLEVARGDCLQLKLNGRSAEGQPLRNGELVTVQEVVAGEGLRVLGHDGVVKTLSPAQCVCVRGYAVTSYASQGKTVDTILLADAACPAATTRNQWYVAISRARRRALVFTEDKTALRSAIQRSGERELALDLVEAQAAPTTRRALQAAESAERVRRHTAAQTIARFAQTPNIKITP